MKDYNKKNLYRLLSLFCALFAIFLGVVTVSVSLRFWWASVPTAGVSLAAAVLLFKKGFIDPDKEEGNEEGKH